MDINQIFFYFISGFILSVAALILISKNIVRSVFMLMLVFVGVAIIYFTMGAEFVGVTQIMIYVGGILILMMFGVMLTSRVNGSMLISENIRIIPGILVGLSMFSLIAYAIFTDLDSFALSNKPMTITTTTKQIGVSLMTNQILALEIMAILLLVALVGASFIAAIKDPDQPK